MNKKFINVKSNLSEAKVVSKEDIKDRPRHKIRPQGGTSCMHAEHLPYYLQGKLKEPF